VRPLRAASGLVVASLAWGGDRAEARYGLALHVSTGAVTHLGVGETLQLRAFPPRAWFGPGLRRPDEAPRPVRPLDVPLLWTVEPVDRASISKDGLLAALRPGEVTIRVEDARRLSSKSPEWVGSPGSRTLTIGEGVDGGRLPRVTGSPPLERFDLLLRGPTVRASAATHLQEAVITISVPIPLRLPLSDAGAPQGTRFDADPPSPFELADADLRRRASVKTSRLTIESWKDGVATGRFLMTTVGGVDFAFAFVAPLDDPDGSLARAAAPKPPR
jgi:hypothetical protein